MHTEDFVINQCRKAEVIENFGAIPPHIHGSIFPQTFIIESINLCDLSAFMISSNQCDAIWVAHL